MRIMLAIIYRIMLRKLIRKIKAYNAYYTCNDLYIIMRITLTRMLPAYNACYACNKKYTNAHNAYKDDKGLQSNAPA